MKALYLIGKLLTFPGAYLKGLWEHAVCRLLGIPVERPAYLALDEGCGHVEHEFLECYARSFCLCLLPGLLNCLLGLPMFAAGALGLLYFGESFAGNAALFVLYALLLYFGFSLLANLFPLAEDALRLWDLLYRKDGTAPLILKILLFLPAACLTFGAYLEKYALNVLLLVLLLVGVNFA